MITVARYMRRKVACLLAVALLATTLAGCGEREEAIAVADAGIETATELAVFYDTLAQKANETYRGHVYLGVLRGTPVNEGTLKSVRSITRSLRLRAKAARDLASLYGSLKKLSSYNASEEVQKESDGLVKDLLALPGLDPGVPISGIASKILGGLAGQKQSRDIRRAATMAHKLLQTMTEIFQAESAVKDASGQPVYLTTDEDGNLLPDGQQGAQLNLYASILANRNLVTASVIEELIRSKVVVAWPVLEKFPLALNLPFSEAGKKAVECPTRTPHNTPEELRKIRECEGVIAVIKSQLREERVAASSASSNMASALEELEKAHQDLLHKQGISLKQWQFYLSEASSYVDELQKVKDAAASDKSGGGQ